MADYGFDGMIKVGWVPTIADISAPTVAELTAGIDLEDHLVPDGLSTPSDTAEIDNSKLSSTFNTAVVGRRNFNGLSVTYVRGSDSGAQEVEDALVYQAAGYLVVRRDVVASTAWAAAQTVEVYPAQAKQPAPADPAENTLQTVQVGFTLTSEPQGYGDPATVAA
jgi:hypothetical protein